MQNRYYSFLQLFGLLVIATACRSLDNVASNQRATTVSPLSAIILFQDDFSNTSSGWDQIDIQEGIADYRRGHYLIVVHSKNTDFWSTPGLEFDDIVIEVSATKTAGPDDNNFGIICRYQDNRNFYFFIISSDGYYGIGKIIDGEQSLVNADRMLPSKAIQQGNTTNQIKAICNGTHLSLYSNNTKLVDVQDNSLKSGDVGLLAGTFLETETTIFFDNFVVRIP